MAKPKLALIPAAYGTKFYSILPSDGVGDFDFSRGSAATRINPEGLIETITSGQSRLNYPLVNGVVKGCPHYLLEPSRTNQLSYSEQFDNASWINNGVTINANQVVSPDGALTADLLTGVSGGFGVVKFGTWTATNKVASCFAKAGSTNIFKIANVSSSNRYVLFDLSNGIVSEESTGWTGSIENFGNGWYRCTAISNSETGTFSLGVTAASESIYIWGAQLESDYKTSYIPTTTTTFTRSAETANGAGDASTFNDSEGVLMVETKGFTDLLTQSDYIQLSKNGESSSTNSLIIQHRNNGFLRIYANGFASANIIFNLNIDFSQNHKIAVLYKLNGYKLFIDGFEQSLYGTPTQTVFSGLDNLSFDLRGAFGWNSQIKQLQYFDLALAGTQIEQLTSWTSFTAMAEAQSYTIK